jgi:DUF438 domain-containing protein
MEESMEDKRWDTFLVGEHEIIERAMDVLRQELDKIPALAHSPVALKRAIDFLIEFGDHIHNQKEEQFLFPLMVERGIPASGPIRVMLLEHEAERGLLQQMMGEVAGLPAASNRTRAEYRQKGLDYLEIRANHIWKENDVLYMMGRQVLTEVDNRELLAAFEGINREAYGDTAAQKFAAMLDEVEEGGKIRTSLLRNLAMDQIEAVMEALPIEVTFVDAGDTVAYFNRLDGEKIFPRTRSVVGRKVQKCHPAHSVHRVLQIINDFKAGSRDEATFWIDFAGDKILIRYFPVRDEAGAYLGTLEVTQRIGEIQKLTGQKRLLD